MACFDIGNKVDRDLRHCRTRAFGAHLLAKYSLNHSNAIAWEQVACAWDELANLKQRVATDRAHYAAWRANLRKEQI
jgi:hypothetical protein